MTALTLTLIQRPAQRVDMSPLVCQKLTDMEPTEIGAITLQNGKRKIRVDELFHISGSDTQNIKIEQSFGKLAKNFTTTSQKKKFSIFAPEVTNRQK